MGVLKAKRGLSKMEFYENARRLRRELSELLRRDFGVRSRRNAGRNDSPGRNVPDDWYAEDMEETARAVRHLLRKLLWDITAANTIYPATETEAEERRRHQTAAVIDCQQLLQELLWCEDSLPISADTLLPYVEMLGREIALLKGWRKDGNRMRRKIGEGKEA